MIKQLEDLPDGVIGFEVHGVVDAEEYRSTLDPAMEAALEKDNGVRLVFVVDQDFERFSGGALWEDTKFGFGHLTGWKRVALVTDVEWMKHLTGLFGWMMPGKVKVFSLTGRDQAIAWAAADD